MVNDVYHENYHYNKDLTFLGVLSEENSSHDNEYLFIEQQDFPEVEINLVPAKEES